MLEGSVNLSTIISFGTTAAGVVAAMAVARFQIKSLTVSVEQIAKDLRKIDTRCDRLETQVETTQQRLSVISGMMSPSEEAKKNREIATIQAELAGLKSSVDTLKHMHNGVHPPVSNARTVG